MKADPNVQLFVAALSTQHGYPGLRHSVRALIRRALIKNRTKRTAAAWLGIHERALYRILERYPDLEVKK